MIQLPVFKKPIEKLTCKEATKMVIPYIEKQVCDKDLRKFVKHIKLLVIDNQIINLIRLEIKLRKNTYTNHGWQSDIRISNC